MRVNSVTTGTQEMRLLHFKMRGPEVPSQSVDVYADPRGVKQMEPVDVHAAQQGVTGDSRFFIGRALKRTPDYFKHPDIGITPFRAGAAGVNLVHGGLKLGSDAWRAIRGEAKPLRNLDSAGPTRTLESTVDVAANVFDGTVDIITFHPIRGIGKYVQAGIDAFDIIPSAASDFTDHITGIPDQRPVYVHAGSNGVPSQKPVDVYAGTNSSQFDIHAMQSQQSSNVNNILDAKRPASSVVSSATAAPPAHYSNAV